jgi:hypothetical protein
VRRPHEDLHGFAQAVRDLVVTYGLPEALYGDQTAIAVRNDRHWSIEEELAGQQRPTQFGQMLEELGVQYIPARSPEAKGRIERFWQTAQDRLPAEVALRGITTFKAFDAFLPQFLVRYRSCFARSARETVPAWRAAPRQLDRIFACRYPRTVSRDNVVTIPGVTLQLPPGSYRRSFAHTRVEVRELLDGRLLVMHDGHVLLEQPAPEGGFTLAPRDSGRDRRRARQQIAAVQSLLPEQRQPRLPEPQAPRGDRDLLERARRRRLPTRPWDRLETVKRTEARG